MFEFIHLTLFHSVVSNPRVTKIVQLPASKEKKRQVKNEKLFTPYKHISRICMDLYLSRRDHVKVHS